jgi:dipeptidyl aminopeptidase/acylaminoacyl peptidase
VRVNTGNSRTDDEEFRTLMAGFDSAIARFPWVDTTKLSVSGQSHRGVTAAWIATKSPRFTPTTAAP